MAISQVLMATGLVRRSRQRGFCPACRRLETANDRRSGYSSGEIAVPAVTALAVLFVAGFAWAVTIVQTRSMGSGMMGLGSVQTFAATWVVMMAAMMLPSAIPLVAAFARTAEGRRNWIPATTALSATYLSVWLLFGAACYVLYNAVGMPWRNQSLAGGAALVLAGLYSLTPLKRASQARCRELCALHGPLPFNLMRSSVVAGVRYGLSCLGCSVALMVAMVLVGMSNLLWAATLGVVVLIYKFAPPLRISHELILSIALAALGIAYAVQAWGQLQM